MMALATVAESDLITAVPRRFAAMHGARFGVVSAPAPLRLPQFRIRAIASKAAMMDAGLAWLFATLRAGHYSGRRDIQPAAPAQASGMSEALGRDRALTDDGAISPRRYPAHRAF